MDDLVALKERVRALEAQVHDLLAVVASRSAPPPPSPVPPPSPAGSGIGRRRALGVAAGVAAAGVTAALAPPSPAGAANGQPFTLGSVGNTATAPTGLAADASGYGLGCTDRGLGALPLGSSGTVFGHTKDRYYAGVLGYAETTSEVGVQGISTAGRAVEAWSPSPTGNEPALFALAGDTFGATQGTALEGQGRIGLRTWTGDDGTGVVAVSGGFDPRPARTPSTAVDAQGLGAATTGIRAQGGRAPLLLVPQGAAPVARTDAHSRGELVEDASGVLWLCVTAGSPGTWRRLAGPTTAGAFQVLPVPARVYDSRPGTAPANGPKTPLAANAPRVLDLKVNSSGVPAGATAALVTLLLVNAQAGSGNLTIWANGAARPAANTMVWGPGGGRFSTPAVSALDGAARVTVQASLRTDLVVDVVGYYR